MQAKNTDRILYNAEEIARMMGLSRGFVYQAIARGELASVRLGRAVRVRVADLHTWVNRNTTSGAR